MSDVTVNRERIKLSDVGTARVKQTSGGKPQAGETYNGLPRCKTHLRMQTAISPHFNRVMVYRSVKRAEGYRRQFVPHFRTRCLFFDP